MVRLVIAFCLLASTLSFAQVSDAGQNEKNYTLAQRYWSMKSKAETYQEYKVVKEYVMDGVWKNAMDSLKEQRRLVVQAHQTISELESNLKTANLNLKKERDASSGVVYDSSHISVMGIPFRKSVFILFVAAIFTLLVFIGSAMLASMKLLKAHAKEKVLIADMITREFEEYKQKTMEKQIKLARELQTERNKLADLKQNLAR